MPEIWRDPELPDAECASDPIAGFHEQQSFLSFTDMAHGDRVRDSDFQSEASKLGNRTCRSTQPKGSNLAGTIVRFSVETTPDCRRVQRQDRCIQTPPDSPVRKLWIEVPTPLNRIKPGTIQ